MKNILTAIILLAAKTLYSQNDEVNIDSFMKNVILNKSFKVEGIDKYVTINKEVLNSKKNELYQILNMNIDDIRKSLDDCGSEYKIVQHYKLEKKQLSEYRLEYNDYDKVYYVLCNQKIVTSIVIKDDKIVSFFTTLKKFENQNYKPWLLN